MTWGELLLAACLLLALDGLLRPRCRPPRCYVCHTLCTACYPSQTSTEVDDVPTDRAASPSAPEDSP